MLNPKYALLASMLTLATSAFAAETVTGKGVVSMKSFNVGLVVTLAKEEARKDAIAKCNGDVTQINPGNWDVYISTREVCPEYFDYCQITSVTAEAVYSCVK